MDSIGELADSLESQPRSGDPHGEGIVFSSIAEIALVGALGGGEYLMQMVFAWMGNTSTLFYKLLMRPNHFMRGMDLFELVQFVVTRSRSERRKSLLLLGTATGHMQTSLK